MIMLFGHAGRCCIGVHLDPASVECPSVLVEGLQAGLDAVAALAGA